ncbi:HTTM domain-containing protein [Isosphaeraceae bacterium EP7]
MGRILSDIGCNVGALAERLARAWARFFFSPADPTSLGLIRILAGSLLTWQMAVVGLDLNESLGSTGWVDPGASAEYLRAMTPGAWTFWPHVPDRLLGPAWAACMLICVAFTVGYRARYAAPLAWAVAVSTANRSPALTFGFDQILATLLLYLAATGASGQALSLDSHRATRRATRPTGPSINATARFDSCRPTVSANLSLRMIQLHLALIYLVSGLYKLPSPEWRDGSAMEMIVLTPEFGFFDLSWLLAYPTLLHLAAQSSVVLELSYPFLIFVRRLRYPTLAGIVLLHLGIIATLGLVEFGLTMIVANLAFIPGGSLRALFSERWQGSRMRGIAGANSSSSRERTRASARAS